jgi:hypothetical protein
MVERYGVDGTCWKCYGTLIRRHYWLVGKSFGYMLWCYLRLGILCYEVVSW